VTSSQDPQNWNKRLTADEILAVMYECVDEVNAQLPSKMRLAKARDTVLVGEGGALDSLTLITFLVAVEDAIANRSGVLLGILDLLVLTEDGPFRTMGSLAGMISERLS
jgi:hypothetical protein